MIGDSSVRDGVRSAFAIGFALMLVSSAIAGVALVGTQPIPNSEVNTSGTATAAPGDVLWYTETTDLSNLEGADTWVSGERTIIGEGGGNIRLLYDENGTEDSTHSISSSIVNDVAVSQPDDVAYAGDDSNTLTEFDLTTKSTGWTNSYGDNVNGVTVSEDGNNLFIVGDFNQIKKVDPSDGSEIWSVPTGDLGRHIAYSEAEDAAIGGSLYDVVRADDGSQTWQNGDFNYVMGVAVNDDDGHVYVVEEDSAGDHYLHALDIADGSKIWKVALSGSNNGAAAYSSTSNVVYAGGGSQAESIAPNGTVIREYSSGSNSMKALEVHPDTTEFYQVQTSGITKFDGEEESIEPVSETETDGTEQPVGLVEDDAGFFLADETDLVVYHRSGSYEPLWRYAGYSYEEWAEQAWEEQSRSSFNWENQTTAKLEDGEYYKFELESSHGTWEDTGFVYDADEMKGSTLWLAPETGHLDDGDDSSSDDGGTSGGSSSDDGDSTTATETEDDGFGPTALGSCTTLDGADGVEVEYWDPEYTTYELEANLSVDGEDTYYIHKEFGDARGYYRGCLADAVTRNASDSRDTDLSHNATNDAGELVSSGSTSYSPPVFGPTGTAPSSTPERLGLLAGVLGALGALWFGGQRYLPGSTIEAWPVDSVSPAFGVGAPIVTVLGLDLAGGGVISAAVATGLAQVAPFAGVVGVAIGGYYALRWIRAPPA